MKTNRDSRSIGDEAWIQTVSHMADFVFDGDSNRPWSTTDQTNPVSVYGHTKRDEERAIMESGLSWTIVRTAWLYDGSGPNFTSMCRLMTERMKSVSWPIRRALRLSRIPWPPPSGALPKRGSRAPITGRIPDPRPGTVSRRRSKNSDTSQACSIHERGQTIITEDYPTPAIEPRYSVLGKTKTWEALEERGRCHRSIGARILKE